MTRQLLIPLAFLPLILAGCGGERTVIPDLTKPIEIVDGGHYDDGGSVSVTLKDAKDSEFTCTYSQGHFPADKYLPDRLYLGKIREVKEGNGTLVPMEGENEQRLADYLQDALSRQRKVSSEEAVEKVLDGDDTLMHEFQRVEAAEGILQYLQLRVAANLEPVNGP